MNKEKIDIKELKKAKARYEQDIVSIRDRVRDIEWSLDCDMNQSKYESLLTERKRALDKLRETQKDLLEITEILIEEGHI